ncbi:hypothetical protein VZO05_15210 [Aggregatilineales bacterium SYSU G02658]
MKSAHSVSVIVFAILLAAAVILTGRLLGLSDSTQEQMRLTALTPGSKFTYLTNIRRDQAEIVVMIVDKNGTVRHSAQQRVRFQSVLPQFEIAQNGTLLLREGSLTNTMTHVRSVYDYNVQFSMPNCQFVALSPNGQTVACVSGTRVQISSMTCMNWETIELSTEGIFGAPRLFNETLVLPRALDDDRVELVVISLASDDVLTALDADTHYAFNRAGTTAITLDEMGLRVLDLTNNGNSFQQPLPAELSDYAVQAVALSDAVDQILLYTEPRVGESAQMAVWHLETDALTWLSAVEMPARPAGEFDPTGTMVAFTMGHNVYVASLVDGKAYWIGRGRNPVWLTR